MADTLADLVWADAVREAECRKPACQIVVLVSRDKGTVTVGHGGNPEAKLVMRADDFWNWDRAQFSRYVGNWLRAAHLYEGNFGGSADEARYCFKMDLNLADGRSAFDSPSE